MKSQVSFKFDGSHNKQPIVDVLKMRLNGLKYIIEQETDYIYIIYVASTATEEETLMVCKGIQHHALLDSNRDLLNKD